MKRMGDLFLALTSNAHTLSAGDGIGVAGFALREYGRARPASYR